MEAIASDLRYAVRQLRKSPGFAAVAVASLALGIGANTAVFSWIDAILLRPLPGVDARGLVGFETLAPSGESVNNSYPDFQDYRDHLRLLSGLAMAQPAALGLGDRDHVDRVWGEMVSGNYFAVLAVKPELGRTFLPEEYGDKPNAYPVAVISDALWRRRFQADPAIAGKIVTVNSHALTVVGVAPPEFHGITPGLAFDVWVPLVMRPQINGIGEWMLRDRKTRDLQGIARLRPGVRIERARAEIAALAGELARAHPYENGGIGATVLELRQASGSQRLLRTPLQILMAACGALLLIVCANMANLLLARAVGRRQELGVRVALGAGRGRLARQLLTESLLLAALGGVLAVPLSLGLGRSLQGLLPRTGLPFYLGSSLNADVMAFTLLLAVGAALLAGLYPVLHACGGGLHEALMEGGGRGGSATVRTRRARSWLVVGEVALALITLIGAGLFARSFESARRIDPGFDAGNVLVAQFHLDTSGYSLAERKQFCLRLRERLQASPGVTAVAYADSVPLGFAGPSWEDLKIEGYLPRSDENMKIIRNVVAPGFFDLLRVPVLDGRDFAERDDEKTLPVMIVNRTFADRFFERRSALGRRVWGWGRWFTVVGVVEDSKYQEINERPRPYFYVPFRQVYREDRAAAFYVRTAGDPNAAIPTLRRQVRLLAPGVGVYDAMPLADYIGAALYPTKVAAILLGALGAWCLALAALGLYGVMAYTVGQRTHEVGVRMALGARPADVLRMVVGQAMLLVAGGLIAGVVAAAGLTRLVSSALIGVGAGDPGVFLGAALMLATVAALASFVPAQRAAAVDPVVALRQR
jgi:predicted permease